MRRSVFVVAGWLAWSLTASIATADSYEELLRENRELRAQIATFSHPQGGASAGDHSHEGEHSGEGDGHDHCRYDFVMPFEEHHDTLDGYPMMHMFKTEHAWLERKVQLSFDWANGADGGEVDESEFEFEFFWAFNSRWALLLEVPMIRLESETSATSGVGDMEVGMQFIAFDGEVSILAFAFIVSTPTGDADRDLGAGNTVLIPKALLWHDLGDGWGLQSDVSLEVPVSVEEPEDEVVYNLGINRVLPGTECCRVFRNLTGSLEVNGHTAINGDESGHTVIALTPGLRWMMREHDQCGVAYSFPVSGDRDSDSEVLFSYIVHF